MKPKRTKITGWIVIIILGLFVAYMLFCNNATAHTMPGVDHIHPDMKGEPIPADDPAEPDTEEEYPLGFDEYDPLHQKVAQLEREIQLLGVQLGSVREELYWLRSINRELIKEIYKRNHL